MPMTPIKTQDEVVERLKKGNERFIKDKLDNKLQDSQRRQELTDGQDPYAIILTCADSRVVPELIFDTGIGELFVIRVAGNIANSSSIASIEYAVANLDVKVVVVMGHESCGAITAAIKDRDSGYNLNMLLAHIKPAIMEVGQHASVNDVVKKNAELTAQDLVMRSVVIQNAFEMGEIAILPAYYNLDSGKVDFLEGSE